MIKIRLKPSCRISASFVTLLVPITTLVTWAKVHILPDSRSVSCQKAWEKQLYMMDSTTITLFDNILKRVGRHPKSGKKKGGIKVHTIMRYQVGVPMVTPLPNRCNKAVPYSFAHSRRCFSDRHFANLPTSVPKPWLIYTMLLHWLQIALHRLFTPAKDSTRKSAMFFASLTDLFIDWGAVLIISLCTNYRYYAPSAKLQLG